MVQDIAATLDVVDLRQTLVSGQRLHIVELKGKHRCRVRMCDKMARFYAHGENTLNDGGSLGRGPHTEHNNEQKVKNDMG